MFDTAGTNDDAVLQTNHYLAQRMRKARVRVAWLEVDDFTVFESRLSASTSCGYA
jgi:hypothetical protein